MSKIIGYFNYYSKYIFLNIISYFLFSNLPNKIRLVFIVTIQPLFGHSPPLKNKGSEFPSMALPIAAILGIFMMLSRKKS